MLCGVFMQILFTGRAFVVHWWLTSATHLPEFLVISYFVVVIVGLWKALQRIFTNANANAMQDLRAVTQLQRDRFVNIASNCCMRASRFCVKQSSVNIASHPHQLSHLPNRNSNLLRPRDHAEFRSAKCRRLEVKVTKCVPALELCAMRYVQFLSVQHIFTSSPIEKLVLELPW